MTKVTETGRVSRDLGATAESSSRETCQRRDELDPKIANAVGYLSTVLLRALEQGPLEERMAKVEVLLGLTQNPHLAEPPTVQVSKTTSEIEVTHGND